MTYRERLEIISENVEKLIAILSTYVAPISEVFLDPLCRNHSSVYIKELDNGVSWAKRMYDSCSKIQSGIITGNVNSFGDFDECINVVNTTRQFVGEYCLATFKVVSHDAPSITEEILRKIIHGDKDANIKMAGLLTKGLKWAFCIPSTCTSHDLASDLEEFIKPIDGFHVELDSLDCHYDQAPNFTVLDWVTVSVFIILATLVLFSTGYELTSEKVRRIKGRRPPAPCQKVRSSLDPIPELNEDEVQSAEIQNNSEDHQPNATKSSSRDVSFPSQQKRPNELSLKNNSTSKRKKYNPNTKSLGNSETSSLSSGIFCLHLRPTQIYPSESPYSSGSIQSSAVSGSKYEVNLEKNKFGDMYSTVFVSSDCASDSPDNATKNVVQCIIKNRDQSNCESESTDAAFQQLYGVPHKQSSLTFYNKAFKPSLEQTSPDSEEQRVQIPAQCMISESSILPVSTIPAVPLDTKGTNSVYEFKAMSDSDVPPKLKPSHPYVRKARSEEGVSSIKTATNAGSDTSPISDANSQTSSFTKIFSQGTKITKESNKMSRHSNQTDSQDNTDTSSIKDGNSPVTDAASHTYSNENNVERIKNMLQSNGISNQICSQDQTLHPADKISPASDVPSDQTGSNVTKTSYSPRSSNRSPIFGTDQRPTPDSETAPHFNGSIAAEVGSHFSMDNDVFDPRYRDQSCLSSFSLLSNGKHVFYIDNRSSSLNSIYGLKFLSVIWLLFGHAVCIADRLPAHNYSTYRHNYRDWYYMLIQNSSLGIDTFFVITGVLISFNFLRDMKSFGIYQRKNGKTGMTWKFFIKYLPFYYFQRFMRLTPVFALMVLIQASIFTYFGSGPFWYKDSYIMMESCRHYWWSALTYLQNYVNGDEMCLSHTWYLMVDMQLYLFSPIMLLAFIYWSKPMNCIINLSLIFLGIWISFFVNYTLELPAGLSTLDPRKWQMKIKYEFITTHTRFVPWVIGLFVGYLLHHWRKSETRPPGAKMGAYHRWLWLLATMGAFYSVFGGISFQTENPENTVFKASVYNCLFRNVWATSIGWLIFACETNNGGFIQTLLAWKAFQPLYRLTYCIYLVHLPLMAARALITRIPIYRSDFQIVSEVSGDVVISSILALGLVLCVELPFVRLYEALTFHCYYRLRLAPPKRESVKQSRMAKGEGDVGGTEQTPLLSGSQGHSYQSTHGQPGNHV